MRISDNNLLRKWNHSENETNTLIVKVFCTEKEGKNLQSLINDFCNKS